MEMELLKRAERGHRVGQTLDLSGLVPSAELQGADFFQGPRKPIKPKATETSEDLCQKQEKIFFLDSI